MNQPENNNRTPDSSDYSEEWLSAYIDDELTDEQRAVVEQRLVSDSETQQLFDDLQRVRGLVNQLPAWSGKLKSASEFIQESGAAILSSDVAVDNEYGHDHTDDYHDKLPPTPDGIFQNESPHHSESIAETLEQDGGMDHASSDAPTDSALLKNRTSLESFAYPGQPRARSWLSPLVLAACLLMLLGGSLWVLNSGSSWTVATSTGGSGELQNAHPSAAATERKAGAEGNDEVDAYIPQASPTTTADNLPERLPELLGANGGQHSEAELKSYSKSASSDASELAKQQSANEDRVAMGFSPPSAPAAAFTPNAMARKQAPTVANEPPQETSPTTQKAMQGFSSSDVVEDSLGESLAGNVRGGRSELARGLGTKRREALGGSTRDGAAMRPSIETEVLGGGSQANANTKVQLAHSAGWSASDIEAALERLAPLLNLPTAQSADRAIADSVAAIPIAVVTPKPLATGATPLGNMLQQQTVALQEVVPANSQPPAWQAPFAQSRVDEPSTVALFVLRDEAEQILQAAQQAGELVNPPVWISSASGTPTPASPKQQVVLLFTPQ